MKARAAVLGVIGADRPWEQTRPIEIRQIDLEAPRPGEVLVRMEAAGVCHSDLSRVSGVRECHVPMVLGHEGCGIVEHVGADVTGVSVGDKVTLTFMPRCGECASCLAPGWRLCERGLAANAAGEMLSGGRRIALDGMPIDHHGGVSAFAEYAVVDQHSVVVLPHEIPSDVGALLGCAVLTGGGAVINAARARAGQSVAIVGLGGVGLAAALVARAIGAHVTAIDTNPAKLTAATELVADDAFLPDEAIDAGKRFDVVVECVGHPAALASAVSLTGVGGTTVTVGLSRPGSTVAVDSLALVTEARSLVGSYMGSGVPATDIQRYAEMYLDGTLPVERLITGSTCLEDLNVAMDRLQDGLEIRQIVRFEPATSGGEE
ncbi:alcohol dehydrogenase catalytic domain-containing protein [Microbacterium rhizosphaerae]|uniref:Alcohol dehydrogenase catalytic domain-containing protein n=1 Tax=Microbacterium rhizosphaerae TaxID=1678237 RepID=A0ABZ0SL54_9MICO|nr:alcohol dehydrogenase catalytic domain-containing protein [Microbacterium rhizosphaerae]WPR89679.1 alcohol dehydrogenase catalytic domain-containing protein [Microbacterium rhizosphaerae]